MSEPMIEVVGGGLPEVSNLQFSLMLDFIEVAQADGPQWVTDCLSVPSCGLYLRDGSSLDCLCAYEIAETGTWVVLTRDNRVLSFLASEVR